MKAKLSTLAMLLLCISISGQSFLDQNKIWTYYVLGDAPPGHTEPHLFNYTVITSIGDTITLDNEIYNRVLETDAFNFDGNNFEFLWNETNNYLREDSTGKVFLKIDTAAEILLYDFSLDVNDVFYNTLYDCEMTLIEKDSIYITNGEKRERFIFEEQGIGNNKMEWIKGVGDTRKFYPDCDDLGYPQFLCLIESDSLVHSFDEYIPQSNELIFYCYWIPVNTSEVEPLNWTLGPNPCTSTITLNTKGDLEKGTLKIIDYAGSIQQTTTLENETIINLDVSALVPGIYFLQSPKGNFKFVKID